MSRSEGVPHGVRYQVRFVTQRPESGPVLFEFADPAPTWALDTPATAEPALELLCVPGQAGDTAPLDEMLAWVGHAGTPLPITLQGTQVIWSSRRAAILTTPERMEAVRLALIEFAHYEQELARLERAIAAGWADLQAVTPLSFRATRRDLERQDELGEQVRRVHALRMTCARLLPHLHRPALLLPALANQLGERLRERLRVEDRIEYVSQQLEVYDRVYEMVSQRLSDLRQSGEEQTLEWIIILLLAAETLLLLVGLLNGQ